MKVNKANLECRINILLYHQVGAVLDVNTNPDCFCQTKEFHRQMEFLANSAFHVIPLQSAVDLIFRKQFVDNKYVVLTFDDGCETFYNVTYPILQKYKFASTIYPVAGYFGRKASWQTIKNTDLKILTKSMLLELNKQGVEIGAHTMDHVKLSQVKEADAIYQVKNSKETIEQILGENVCSFAYPHGDFSKQVIEIVEAAGFSNALTCESNCAEVARSVFEIPRKYITYYDDLDKFKEKIS